MKDKSTTASISLEDVSEDLVIEYICTHPEFFQIHPDLLESLHIPHECGPAISLIERQVQLLRQKNQLQQAELMNSLNIARENQRIFELTKKLTLGLLKAKSLTDAIATMIKMLKADFKVEFVRIGLNLVYDAHDFKQEVFVYRPNEQPAIKDLLKLNKTICKTLSNEELLYFFANKASVVQSCVIIPMGRQGMYGFLALGSSDKLKFHRDKDTLFLDYLGKVLGQIIGQYLVQD